MRVFSTLPRGSRAARLYAVTRPAGADAAGGGADGEAPGAADAAEAAAAAAAADADAPRAARETYASGEWGETTRLATGSRIAMVSTHAPATKSHSRSVPSSEAE